MQPEADVLQVLILAAALSAVSLLLTGRWRRARSGAARVAVAAALFGVFAGVGTSAEEDLDLFVFVLAGVFPAAMQPAQYHKNRALGISPNAFAYW